MKMDRLTKCRNRQCRLKFCKLWQSGNLEKMYVANPTELVDDHKKLGQLQMPDGLNELCEECANIISTEYYIIVITFPFKVL